MTDGSATNRVRNVGGRLLLTADQDNEAASSTIEFLVDGSEKMRIDSSGHAIIPGGVTLGTAAGTYNAANTLDDYEEGTWTPTYTGQSGSPTSISYDVQEAHYTKVGSVVTVVGKIQTSGITGNFSGSIRLSGLPFAAIPATETSAAGGMVVANCLDFLDDFPCSGYLRENTTHITLRTRDDFKSQMRDMLNTDMLKVGSGNSLSFSATYITDE